MQQLPQALQALTQYKQFIIWKIAVRDGKQIKLPIDYRTLQSYEKGSNWQQDPEAWTTADVALKTASLCGPEFGVGFFFTINDPFYFVDIDHCLNSDGATWSQTALDVLALLPGAAVEISQSGTGLHIIGCGVCPDHACKNVALGLELYTQQRFVALTGTSAMGDAATNNSATLPTLVATYYPPNLNANPDSAEWTKAPVAEWTGLTDDNKLIEKALASTSGSNVFGNKATFADLWERNVQALSDAYTPDSSDTSTYDESTADMALAQHLAFWTGNNCERIFKLMWSSKLVRDKWQRDDYLKRTILRTVSMQDVVYTGGKAPERERVPVQTVSAPLGKTEGPEILQGYQYLASTQQIDLFKGCTYVQDLHKIFLPSGNFVRQEQFNATFGGFVFQLDDQANGKITRKPWEAFTESQVVRYPKAETTCFRPDLQPGELVHDEDRIAVNTYVPLQTQRVQGDPAKFLNHLAKLLPDERDRKIILSYMAACVQYKGIKFQWAPLIQGVEGNGKTLFTRCVAHAIGERYTHMPPVDQISEKYNDWLFEKLFIGVEDVYFPDHKREVIEILKPMITNDRHAIRQMNVSQVMKSICCNFIFNSNHKDAIRKTRNDRRYCVFYTAQQHKADLERDGMRGYYFPDLYNWLKGEGQYATYGRGYGYAVITDYLYSYAIEEEFNPATLCHDAPDTSSTDEAITMSTGAIEQEIIEAVHEDRPGFAGGWISSIAIDNLLNDLRMSRAIPRNRRREMMIELGYDYHPGLKDGRVNNLVMPDDGKPRLFIKNEHLSLNITSPAEIAKAYQKAQQDTALIGNAENIFNRKH